MSIITISRGTFSGGKAIAECVASRLEYDCVSREVMLEAAERYGVSATALAAAIEKAPRFLERLGHHRDAYLAFFRATLSERALHDRLVYHGNAGHFLLAGVGHVIRARVVAPLEQRVEAAMKLMSVSQAEALGTIERIDQERTRWTQFLYHVAWQDPCHYDIILNLEKMSIESACEVLVGMTRQEDFRATDESLSAMRNLALKSRVLAALFADTRTAGVDVDLLTDDGVITVRGWVGRPETMDAVEEIVRGVEGVRELHCELATRTGFPI